MMSLVNILVSPFEQFDSVLFILSNTVFEKFSFIPDHMQHGIAPWGIAIEGLIPDTLAKKSLNIKMFLILCYIVSIGLYYGINNKNQIIAYLNVTFALNISLMTYKELMAYKQDFSFLFFFLFFYLITGGLITFWFTDVSLTYPSYSWPDSSTDLVKEYYLHRRSLVEYPWDSFAFILTSEVYPQLNIALLLDENLISFFAIFFLFNGAEEGEDANFILDQEEADFIGDIVAPLFISNLGKNVEENGALFLKITGIFGFILVNNLMGMLPYSDTSTSSLILTFWVALSVFVSLLTLMITKHGVTYLFNLFLPHGTPFTLIFLLIPIEFVSYTFRLLSLSVRLFANMMAGHTLLKVIVGFSWSMLLMGDFFLIGNLFPIGILFVLIFLEIGVALIQTYVFTILTCMYLKDIFVSH